MTDADAPSPLARVWPAKRAEETPPSITGTKVLLFAVQLTLVAGLLDGLVMLAYAAVALGVIGLLTPR